MTDQLSPNPPFLQYVQDNVAAIIAELGLDARYDAAGAAADAQAAAESAAETYANANDIAGTHAARVFVNGTQGSQAFAYQWSAVPLNTIDYDPDSVMGSGPGGYAYFVPVTGIYAFSAAVELNLGGSSQDAFYFSLFNSGNEMSRGMVTPNFITGPSDAVDGPLGMVVSDVRYIGAGAEIYPALYAPYNGAYTMQGAQGNYFSGFRVA